MKSNLLRAVALASSVSIGVFLVARANSGCSSETQGVAQPEVPPPSSSAPEALSGQPAATTTAEEQFFQGSKAPGGTGLRPPAPAASSVNADDEEFMGTSKSGRLIRKPSAQPNANPPAQQK